jgi:hypothetical protein
MYDDSIKLIEMPDHNSISVCLYNEDDGIFELGERISQRYAEAYMNGYNWDALITAYVKSVDKELMDDIGTDPEAGMFSAYIEYSPENLEKMKRFERHVRAFLSDEDNLMRFIENHFEEIEWD